MYRNFEYVNRQCLESTVTVLSPQPDANPSYVKLQSELFCGGCAYSVTSVVLKLKYMYLCFLHIFLLCKVYVVLINLFLQGWTYESFA